MVAAPSTFRFLLVLFTLLAMFGSGGASANPADVGSVRFVKEANTAFDTFTRSPTGAQSGWMRANFFRQKTYSPYFDRRTDWYPNAWAYKDLYAIYRGSELERARPDWILRDARGQKLFIPWGCEAGSCPQYAGDITSPAFRAHWIAEARATLAQGYRGLFIDDVNLEFRVGDGSGEERPPVDPESGATMTHAQWRGHVADFVEQVRRELPGVEIAHNPIWFAGHSDPATARALLAADYIALERGVSDDGLTPGSGRYGFNTLLDHVDWLHRHGKAVVWDSYGSTREAAEYNLATYFLTGAGRDGIRTDYRALPDDWWPAYDTELGAARGERYLWNGVLRRDFAYGYVLVNGPGGPTRTLPNPPAATNAENVPQPRTTLPPTSGAIVLTPAGGPDAAGVGPAPAGRLTLNVVPNPRRDVVSGPARAERRSTRLRRAVLIKGRAAKARRGQVRLRVERRRGRGWRVAKATGTRLRRDRPEFGRLIRRLPAGRYRVRASYEPAAGGRAVSRTRGFRLRG